MLTSVFVCVRGVDDEEALAPLQLRGQKQSGRSKVAGAVAESTALALAHACVFVSAYLVYIYTYPQSDGTR